MVITARFPAKTRHCVPYKNTSLSCFIALSDESQSLRVCIRSRTPWTVSRFLRLIHQWRRRWVRSSVPMISTCNWSASSWVSLRGATELDWTRCWSKAYLLMCKTTTTGRRCTSPLVRATLPLLSFSCATGPTLIFKTDGKGL